MCADADDDDDDDALCEVSNVPTADADHSTRERRALILKSSLAQCEAERKELREERTSLERRTEGSKEREKSHCRKEAGSGRHEGREETKAPVSLTHSLLLK